MFWYINRSVWCEIWGSHSGVSVDSSFLCCWASSSDISKALWSFGKLVTIYRLTQHNIRESFNFMECVEFYFINAWQPKINGLKHSLFQQNFLSFTLYSCKLFLMQVSTILQQRSSELCTPQLKVSIFNMERNELAKEGMEARVSSASISLTELEFPHLCLWR